MAFLGFVIAMFLCHHFMRRLWRQWHGEHLGEDKNAMGPSCDAMGPSCVSWHEEWHRQWAEKFQRQAEHRARQFERHWGHRRRRAERRRHKHDLGPAGPTDAAGDAAARAPGGETGAGRTAGAAAAAPGDAAGPAKADAVRRARQRAAVEAGFYLHFVTYLGVIAFLALINLLTARYPWFIWPAMGWGIGVLSHYMAVFGSRAVRERFFDRALERELRRERATMQTEKQASIDELSSSIAHEIRNPIAAAKSLVQQMGEDPTSVENVEYAKVALTELDRVEQRISHLLRYAKEEDYTFAPVNLAAVVDSALTQLRAKLDAAKVAVARNYIAGPTVLADAEKLRGVFVNVLDNAIDALAAVPEGRRIDLFMENGDRRATVRVRDNGCGIPADRIDRIFNPFFTTKETGTGLGMAIAKKTVEAHEGLIDVVSEPGRGAEFRITLPLPARS
jgi:signal transduction histidine kinase